MGRQRSLLVVAAVSVLATSGAWYAGSRISSPDAARAATRPPKASLITVPVERRQLSANIVMRGDLSYDESTPISLTGSSETKSVVTKAPPEVGTQLRDGQLLLEVSGRPVFVLQGDLPVFRTLSRGVTGDDVAQLEAALARLGYSPGTVDSTFDVATESALAAFYRNAGYTPKEPSKEARDAADNAREEVANARRSLREAIRAQAADDTKLKTSERLQLESAIDQAEAALASAQTGAQNAVKDDQAKIAVTQNELDQAVAAKRVADATLSAAQAPGAIDRDTGDPYTPTRLAELSGAATSAGSAVTAKSAELDAARSAATANATDKLAAVAEAQRQLQIAQVSLLERLAPPDGSSAAAAVADANAAVADAERRLADAEAQTGVSVPLGEVIFVRSLPRQINEVRLARGDTASGTAVTISGSDLKIRSKVAPGDRADLVVGTKVKIDDPDLDVHFDGVISAIADRPGPTASETAAGADGNGSGSSAGSGDGGTSGSNGGSGGDDDRYRIEITPGALPADVSVDLLAGVNFKITVPVKTTDGDVLAVPLAALSAAADGSARVQVEDRPGSTRFVTVSKGLSAQGYVEVRPVSGAELDEGDLVVVGS